MSSIHRTGSHIPALANDEATSLKLDRDHESISVTHQIKNVELISLKALCNAIWIDRRFKQLELVQAVLKQKDDKLWSLEDRQNQDHPSDIEVDLDYQIYCHRVEIWAYESFIVSEVESIKKLEKFDIGSFSCNYFTENDRVRYSNAIHVLNSKLSSDDSSIQVSSKILKWLNMKLSEANEILENQDTSRDTKRQRKNAVATVVNCLPIRVPLAQIDNHQDVERTWLRSPSTLFQSIIRNMQSTLELNQFSAIVRKGMSILVRYCNLTEQWVTPKFRSLLPPCFSNGILKSPLIDSSLACLWIIAFWYHPSCTRFGTSYDCRTSRELLEPFLGGRAIYLELVPLIPSANKISPDEMMSLAKNQLVAENFQQRYLCLLELQDIIQITSTTYLAGRPPQLALKPFFTAPIKHDSSTLSLSKLKIENKFDVFGVLGYHPSCALHCPSTHNLREVKRGLIVARLVQERKSLIPLQLKEIIPSLFAGGYVDTLMASLDSTTIVSVSSRQFEENKHWITAQFGEQLFLILQEDRCFILQKRLTHIQELCMDLSEWDQTELFDLCFPSGRKPLTENLCDGILFLATYLSPNEILKLLNTYRYFRSILNCHGATFQSIFRILLETIGKVYTLKLYSNSIFLNYHRIQANRLPYLLQLFNGNGSTLSNLYRHCYFAQLDEQNYKDFQNFVEFVDCATPYMHRAFPAICSRIPRGWMIAKICYQNCSDSYAAQRHSRSARIILEKIHDLQEIFMYGKDTLPGFDELENVDVELEPPEEDWSMKTGPWLVDEEKRLLEGLAQYPPSKLKKLASIVRTRTWQQVRIHMRPHAGELLEKYKKFLP